MNERIRALAEQAGYGRDRWTTTEQFEDFLHSLVHSVVQECVNAVDRSSVCFTADQVRIKQLAISELRKTFQG